MHAFTVTCVDFPRLAPRWHPDCEKEIVMIPIIKPATAGSCMNPLDLRLVRRRPIDRLKVGLWWLLRPYAGIPLHVLLADPGPVAAGPNAHPDR